PLGLEGGLITALAADPGSPGTLFAGADGGVWKSTDGGGHWSLTSLGSDPQGRSPLTVRALVADPGAPGRIFALTEDGTFRSADAGTTWERVLSNSSNGALDLAVSPADPDVVMAVVDQHVLRSDDGGDHWVLVLAPTLAARTSVTTARWLVFDPADPS